MINVLLVDLGTPRNEISEPLGIETLVPYVESELGNQVSLDLRSLELDNLPSIEPYLRAKTYSVVGLSTKIRAADRFRKSMKAIREQSLRSLIVVGDILGTYAFEEVLARYPEVICVRGEGEESFVAIIESLLHSDDRRSLSLSHIPNLAYMVNGQPLLTPRKPFDVSKAKPPKRLLAREILKQQGIGRLEASRGCTYSYCEFCGVVEKYAQPGWKPFGLDFVLSELRVLSEMEFTSPYFTDEDFFGDNIDRIYELISQIAKAKANGEIDPSMNLYINLRTNSVLGLDFGGEQVAVELLRKLQGVGLREVFIGIESGCKDQLIRRYRKGVTKQKNIRAIEILRGLGLEVDLGFIFFDQDSTIEELRENLAFIYGANIACQDSQLIKRIRIEPRTPLGLRFAAQNPGVQIDLNLVEYPYDFRDPRVEAIFHIFTNWQKKDLDVIYNLQSFCRGEIPRGYSRREVKKIIAQYRELDIQFLDAIVSIFEREEPNKDKQIRDAMKEYEVRRNTLDTLFIQRILWLNSNFRRFGV